jgi:DNA-binding LytR/AlgR family response regulator
MKRVKVLVVEDEIIIADHLCDTLEAIGYKTIEPAINYTEALIQIKNNKPTIAIIDIQLGGAKTGIDLANYIKENHKFPFIFLTSNSDKATINKAKKVNPSAYLVKPFSKNDLYATIEIVLSNFYKKTTNEPDFMFLKEGGSFSKVEFEELLYLKSESHFVEFKFKNKKPQTFKSTFNELVEKLPSNFIRIHRNFIINIDFIQKIEKSMVQIYNEELPVGGKYKVGLLTKIDLLT